jgi:ATPase subunit of ABC transporter with duplicated ATPase domains
MPISRGSLDLHTGQLDYYKGNFTSYLSARAERRKNLQREYEAQLAYRQHLQAFIDRWRYNANRAAQVCTRYSSISSVHGLIFQFHLSVYRHNRKLRFLRNCLNSLNRPKTRWRVWEMDQQTSTSNSRTYLSYSLPTPQNIIRNSNVNVTTANPKNSPRPSSKWTTSHSATPARRE